MDDSDDEVEYDEEGNPIIIKKSKVIDPLLPIDHSSINYPDFTKNFYQEHEDIAALNEQQVAELRRKLGISVGCTVVKLSGKMVALERRLLTCWAQQRCSLNRNIQITYFGSVSIMTTFII